MQDLHCCDYHHPGVQLHVVGAQSEKKLQSENGERLDVRSKWMPVCKLTKGCLDSPATLLPSDIFPNAHQLTESLEEAILLGKTNKPV